MKYKKKSKSKIKFKIQNSKSKKSYKINKNRNQPSTPFIYLFKNQFPSRLSSFYEMIANNCLINVKFFNNRLI